MQALPPNEADIYIRTKIASRGRAASADAERLIDFIPRLSPQYESPHHLAAYCEALDRAEREPVFAVIHAPPRHAKTDTTLHYIAKRLKKDPTTRIGYASYAARLARRKSLAAQRLAVKAGVKLDRTAAEEWTTTAGGGVFSAGRGGPFTGEGFDLILLDDLFKNRAEAESVTIREGAWEWFTSTARTRLEPGGSIFCPMTRWHEDDPPGRMLGLGYLPISLPAIDDGGQALWPARYDEKALAGIRTDVGEMDWWSLYQGSPRPRGGALFQGTHLYDSLPATYQQGAGLDFAYTASTRADWCVYVEGVAYAGKLYLTDVQRKQCQIGEWRQDLLARRRMNRTAKWVSYVGGQEKAIVELLNTDLGLRIDIETAGTDKYVRAQPASADWNAGNILLPSKADLGSGHWREFIRVVLGFTGVKDREDDDVDALAGLHRALMQGGQSKTERRKRLLGHRAGVSGRMSF